MDNSAANFDGVSSLAAAGTSGSRSTARRYRLPFSASNLIQAPLSALLEYSGILLPESSHAENESLVGEGFASMDRELFDESVSGTRENVSIRIVGIEDQDNGRPGTGIPQQESVGTRRAVDLFSTEEGSTISSSFSRVGLESANGDRNTSAVNLRDSTYQRYDIQQVVRWIEPALPFSLLLLVVFVRQHLQGFFVTIWLAAVMFKSNDILWKQTALKGERKISILVGVTLILILHIVGVYWWYRNGDLFYPWVMLPPKDVPPFWQAMFIILVNDTIVRQVAMVIKCALLMHYKNTRGHNYCRQGQFLTLVEYLVLLYRALLPAPVWYRFFLNKEYGSFFSSLTTGLYLTFKLTSVVGKVQSFLAVVKAISWKEIQHYGSHASAEQVIAAGDLCSICQKKMHAPIILACKHIFCEECTSEWFERERACPICRALVKPEDLIKSLTDGGSTSLFFQIF